MGIGFAANRTPVEALDWAVRLDFDGVEFCLRASGACDLNTWD